MSPASHYEQQFLDALRDIFIGAKVEGDSGYINLMRIKSRYYAEGVFPQMMKEARLDEQLLTSFLDFYFIFFNSLFELASPCIFRLWFIPIR